MVGICFEHILGNSQNIPGFSILMDRFSFHFRSILANDSDLYTDSKIHGMDLSPQNFNKKIRSILPISSLLAISWILPKFRRLETPICWYRHFCCLSGIKWPWRCFMPHGVGRRCADATWASRVWLVFWVSLLVLLVGLSCWFCWLVGWLLFFFGHFFFHCRLFCSSTNGFWVSLRLQAERVYKWTVCLLDAAMNNWWMWWFCTPIGFFQIHINKKNWLAVMGKRTGKITFFA